MFINSYHNDKNPFTDGYMDDKEGQVIMAKNDHSWGAPKHLILKKKAWRPEKGKRYLYLKFDRGSLCVAENTWYGDPQDIARLIENNAYPCNHDAYVVLGKIVNNVKCIMEQAKRDYHDPNI
jgi:hypothetical protein